jgi:ribosomal protein S18 acetylase RimI-like enzyme
VNGFALAASHRQRVSSWGNVIRWGKECARAGAWRGDGSVAFLVPSGVPPSAEFVRRCLALLAEQGFKGVVTGALSPAEQRGFLEAGFGVHEHLHLLLLDLSDPLPPLPSWPRLHAAGLRRRRGLLAVDALAFAPFWRLDRAGLHEALKATQDHRLRVALAKRSVVGYAVCGASAGRGFVQRLAVSPDCQGRGLGRKLLLDGLYWLRAMGVREVAVNTQVGNDAALALYHRLGFRDDLAGLSVLTAGLAPSRAE